MRIGIDIAAAHDWLDSSLEVVAGSEPVVRRYRKALRELEETRQNLERANQCLSRVCEWTNTYGHDLVPPSADTYGEGKRDAKKQVRRMISAALELPAEKGGDS